MAKARQAADHERSAAWTGGAEWFLTSLRFLGGIVRVLGQTYCNRYCNAQALRETSWYFLRMT